MAPDELWLKRLESRLHERRDRGLLRHRDGDAPPGDSPPGNALVDLRHNDYLGHRTHPQLLDALTNAASRHGAGAGAARLIADSPSCRALESAWAGFVHMESALLLPTGYAANLAAIGGLVLPGDVVLLDRACHASLIDAARLAAATVRGVRWRTFPHRRCDRALALAERHIERSPGSTVHIVSESVFSMDGDIAPIEALAAVRDAIRARDDGDAVLLLDEAHAVGVLGPRGAGLDSTIADGADILIATGGKALGVMGGLIAGPGRAVESIVNFARPFVYSTGAMPGQAAALLRSVELLAEEPDRRRRLTEIASLVRDRLRDAGWPVAAFEEHPTPIIPLRVSGPGKAGEVAAHLASRAVLAPAIRAPTVPPGEERVRLSLSATLSDSMIDRLIDAAAGCAEHAARPAVSRFASDLLS